MKLSTVLLIVDVVGADAERKPNTKSQNGRLLSIWGFL
jgi:hypothetical protein